MLRCLTKKITRKNLEKFISENASDKRTLDIGCAGSQYARYFPNRVGLDIHMREGVDIVGDAHKLPFTDEEFDNILCTEVMEHLYSPYIAVNEMKRVLKKGGKLILTTRFIFPLHDVPGDYFRYTKYGLRKLFEDGWEIEELKEEVSTKDTLAVLLQRIGYQTKMRCNFLMKIIIFLVAKFISILPNLIVEEYGNIGRSEKATNILTSGYYLTARRK